MPSEQSGQWLIDIRDNARLAQSFIAGKTYAEFQADRQLFYAVTRCLEIISEASRRLVSKFASSQLAYWGSRHLSRVSLATLVVVLLTFGVANAVGQTQTGLPLNLAYFMSRKDVFSHMQALDMYRDHDVPQDTVAYITPDPATDTKNGLFLKFKDNKLVEISSMKTGMDKALYDKYMHRLLDLANKWKSLGMHVVLESSATNYYLYKDDKSYVSISGDISANRSKKYYVTTTFTELHFFEAKAKSTK